MQRFLVEIRIQPELPECRNCGDDLAATDDGEGFTCPDCGRFYEAAEFPEKQTTAEELASVLANSTAAEALATGLQSRIEFEVLAPDSPAGVPADGSCYGPHPMPACDCPNCCNARRAAKRAARSAAQTDRIRRPGGIP